MPRWRTSHQARMPRSGVSPATTGSAGIGNSSAETNPIEALRNATMSGGPGVRQAGRHGGRRTRGCAGSVRCYPGHCRAFACPGSSSFGLVSHPRCTPLGQRARDRGRQRICCASSFYGQVLAGSWYLALEAVRIRCASKPVRVVPEHEFCPFIVAGAVAGDCPFGEAFEVSLARRARCEQQQH